MRFLAVAVFALTVSAGAAWAQAVSDKPYNPGLGDLMTATVQPRHIKLGLAGQQKNWTYADYELHELREAFERAEAVWPIWQKIPITQMIHFNTDGPLQDIEKAIKAGDADQFNAAYKQLTEACDTCHQGANRGWIVIKVPDAAMFPDQDFGVPPK
jgi:hypothetical protein